MSLAKQSLKTSIEQFIPFSDVKSNGTVQPLQRFYWTQMLLPETA